MSATLYRPPIIRAGTIGINLKGKADPLGSINNVLQGDAESAHAWLMLPSGKIATTGAKWGFLYGEVDPWEYLPRRPFFLLQTVDPIPDDKLAIIQSAHDEMMASGIRRAYGFWKFGLLETLAWERGFVDKMGKAPKTTAPAFPICSQAVSYPFWKAGIPIGKMFGKQDWTAVLPQTLLDEAKAVQNLLDNGWIDREKKPCLKLHLVRDKPFVL